MTAVPRQVGRQVAWGLVAVVAAVIVALAGESTAGAAIDRHLPHSRGAAANRDIRRERLLRGARNPGGAKRAKAGTARRAARPWTVSAPSAGLAADLMTLGGPDGQGGLDTVSLPVPPLARAATSAGWYQFTSVPGAAGNAVIVGHVDTYLGPAAFYNLYRLRPGDLVYVSADGTRQRFDVTSVRELPKPDFPVNLVFGATKRHVLWLITCGGTFDYKTRHYLDNIVVSAAWVPAHEKQRDEKEHTKRAEGRQESIRFPR
jgi:LPXTG-site transpeptidase (sortase) family protein